MRLLFFILIPLFLFGAKLEIGSAKLEIEIAKTVEERSRGLQGRSSLGKDEGMLFVFETPEIVSFWMKETKIPLSIGFFDETKALIQSLDMTPPSSADASLKVYQSSKPALYALEVPQGWFEQNKIRPGMKFYIR